ncbi:F0F1 ATP synthase subunit A [Aliiglaciecola sp. LCG003]|uniref:F0F1 ATP synthase subunit A n=1 Tax=Aliiglaciecola sp. LCG003 TaxID=3053655 RepID=UPI002573A072|nr:F0F1 ATP synthase subunit A [Aliiglaciecola sp. LCG003]WJG07701.1 F0F1 ATP synthase subunit A [Aliiglaciecola sp. LCG003]
MDVSPDSALYWQFGWLKLNATIVFTWVIMGALVISAKLITRTYKKDFEPTRWQYALEIIVSEIEKQIAQVGVKVPRDYIGFLGSLFLFVAVANLFTIFPGYAPPTGSFSTTFALALSVFFAVPFFGIRKLGLKNYLSSYTKPTLLMLPFNIIGELSRTLALAVRLFGNIMSGSMILALLLVISPFIFPVFMTALGLLTGLVQAYIFFILATVYIAAATASTESNLASPDVNQSNTLER